MHAVNSLKGPVKMEVDVILAQRIHIKLVISQYMHKNLIKVNDKFPIHLSVPCNILNNILTLSDLYERYLIH